MDIDVTSEVRVQSFCAYIEEENVCPGSYKWLGNQKTHLRKKSCQWFKIYETFILKAILGGV